MNAILKTFHPPTLRYYVVTSSLAPPVFIEWPTSSFRCVNVCSAVLGHVVLCRAVPCSPSVNTVIESELVVQINWVQTWTVLVTDRPMYLINLLLCTEVCYLRLFHDKQFNPFIAVAFLVYSDPAYEYFDYLNGISRIFYGISWLSQWFLTDIFAIWMLCPRYLAYFNDISKIWISQGYLDNFNNISKMFWLSQQ